MNLITLEAFYVIVGIVLLLVAGRIAADAAHPKRWGSALFWALLAVTFLFGRAIPPVVTGYLVLAMVVLAAAKQVGRSSGAPGSSPAERTAHEERLRHRLLWPALLIPATAVAGTLLLARVHFGSVRLIEASQAALISLSLGALFALGLGRRSAGRSSCRSCWRPWAGSSPRPAWARSSPGSSPRRCRCTLPLWRCWPTAGPWPFLP
jgi:uncharacterized membrane protein